MTQDERAYAFEKWRTSGVTNRRVERRRRRDRALTVTLIVVAMVLGVVAAVIQP